MTCSPARLASNRANALKSTGPKTAEGKERSRANALKHGLAGAGIVLPDEDAAEVEARFAEFQADLNPQGGVGRFLVHRAALLSVRLDRCARYEAAALSEQIRNAEADFDDRRLRESEHAIDWIAHEPATHARRLHSTLEGLDRLIQAWLALGTELDNPAGPRWDYGQWQRLENLMGRRPEDFPLSDAGVASKAYWGDATYLEAEQLGLDAQGRRDWARERLIEIVIGEVRKLRVLREGFDPASITANRAEAGARALFDPSREAILARKYEAAAERGLYRALRELREVEASADPEPAPEVESLGSFEAEPESEPSPPARRSIPGPIPRSASGAGRSAGPGAVARSGFDPS